MSIHFAGCWQAIPIHSSLSAVGCRTRESRAIAIASAGQKDIRLSLVDADRTNRGRKGLRGIRFSRKTGGFERNAEPVEKVGDCNRPLEFSKTDLQ